MTMATRPASAKMTSVSPQALKPLMNPRKKVDLKLIIVGALG